MEQREQIERAADRLRGELLQTLHELDRRRHEAFTMKAVKRELVHHKRDVELAAAGAVLVVGAGVALAVSRHRYRERHRLERRLRAVSRAWSHPERLATKADDRPLGEAIARSILMAGLTTLGAQLGKRLARDFLPAKR